jgi:hypothetical protein
MSNIRHSRTDPNEPIVYEIRLQGHLGSEWADWFGGLTITREDNGETLITGPGLDQAALHGLLRKVRDLGMTLISAQQVDKAQAARSRTHPNYSAQGEEEEWMQTEGQPSW